MGTAGAAPFFRKVRQKVNFESGDSGNALAEAVLAAAEQAGLPQLAFNQDGIATRRSGLV